MGRTLETLIYGAIAAVIVCGSLYGLARVAESGAPAPPPAPAALAPPPLPPLRAFSAAPAAPWRAPAEPQNVVRTATRTYYLPAASPAQSDLDTYNSLRHNCYANAAGNRDGEFPALQQAACDRFSAFARSRGWDTGPLPAYAAPQPRAAGQQVTVIGQAQAVDGAQCAALYAQEQDVEAALRAGYQEPLGNELRARQRDLQEQLWRLHCPRR
jgi:hypothetical protein